MLLINTRYPPSQAYVTLTDFGYPVYALWLGFYEKHLKYSAFRSVNITKTYFHILKYAITPKMIDIIHQQVSNTLEFTHVKIG